VRCLPDVAMGASFLRGKLIDINGLFGDCSFVFGDILSDSTLSIFSGMLSFWACAI